MTTTQLFAPITKSEKQADGSMLVYGKLTGPDLDLDLQIADPAWLARAVPDWFKVGNIREMHQPIAVGKAKELEQDGDDYWITAKIVDEGAVAKIEEEIYTGFSIGIKSPRIAKDAVAKGGRIVGGQIIEGSLVDAPCNETCKLVLAKMAGGTLVPGLAKAEGEPPGDELDEGGEVDLVAAVRDMLAQLLVEEASEVLEGAGTTMPVRILVNLIDDVTWYEAADAYDDVNAAAAAMKAALTTKEAPVELYLSNVADLAKAAAAEGASDSDRAQLAELRKALGVAELADHLTTTDERLTKVATTAEGVAELDKKLDGVTVRLTKVEETPVPGGPMRTVPTAGTVQKAAGDLEADRLEKLADTVTDPHLAAGYRLLAKQLRAAATD